MPKLTRRMFTESVADLWANVQQNFAKDHRIHGHVVAIDAMGRQMYFMHATANDSELLARGIVPVPGPWQDYLGLLRTKFIEHEAVAGILIDEAWFLTGDADAHPELMHALPSQSPERQEMVFIAGMWPREYVSIGYKATIDRPALDDPRLVDHEPLTDEYTTMVVAWLDDILPQPHN